MQLMQHPNGTVHDGLRRTSKPAIRPVVWELFDNGRRPTEVSKILSRDEYAYLRENDDPDRDPVSLRTLQNWYRDYQQELDEPWYPFRPGASAEDDRIVMDALAEAEHLRGDRIELTRRVAQWLVDVTRRTTDLYPWCTLEIAIDYDRREAEDRPVHLLHGLLKYQPWLSPGDTRDYFRAIRNGIEAWPGWRYTELFCYQADDVETDWCYFEDTGEVVLFDRNGAGYVVDGPIAAPTHDTVRRDMSEDAG